MGYIKFYKSFALLGLLIILPIMSRAQGQISRPNPAPPKPTPVTQVTVSKPDGFINGYGYVDLGLPSGLKWAYSNLGATTPIEDGDRYARGEIKPKRSFTAENYEFVTVLEDGTQQFGKYPNPYEDDVDLDHDAAHYSRGATWRIPSSDDWEELCANCIAKGVVYKGKKGMLLTSKYNGKSIFLPLTPLMYKDGHTAKNSGDYWSASTGKNAGALSFDFPFLSIYKLGGCSSANAILGRAIRAVAKTEQSIPEVITPEIRSKQLYFKGDSLYSEKDYTSAFRLFQEAADLGSIEAMNKLGIMYRRGDGVKQHYEESIKWLTKAAEQNDDIAQCTLGIMYANGEGVKQNYDKAMEWYHKAASQENAVALNNIGVLYYSGRGVKQDYATAAEWYEKAADKGYPLALYNLGLMYYYGEGVPKDKEKSKSLLTKAANHGENMAKQRLVELF